MYAGKNFKGQLFADCYKFLDSDDELNDYCGEVYVSEKSVIIMVCSLCSRMYEDLPQLLQHVQLCNGDINKELIEDENEDSYAESMQEELEAEQNPIEQTDGEGSEFEGVEEEFSYASDAEEATTEIESNENANAVQEVPVEYMLDVNKLEQADEHIESEDEVEEFLYASDTGEAVAEMESYENAIAVEEAPAQDMLSVNRLELADENSEFEGKVKEFSYVPNTSKAKPKRRSKKNATVAMEEALAENILNVSELEQATTSATELQLPTFQCQKCGKCFERKRNYAVHMQTHSDVRNYKCPFCDMAFKTCSTLHTHKKTHNKVKTCKCQYCEKAFKTNRERKTHERIHTGEKPYICAYCGRRFLTGSELVQHIRKHENVRPHKCDICEKCFLRSKDLEKHILVHTGVRNFECDICHAKFKQQITMLTHKKIHANAREYKCKYCYKAFNQKPGLTMHMKIHLKDICT